MVDSNFLTQIVIAISSIITTYLTVKHGPKITNKIRGLPANATAEDRFNAWADGYERLIKQQQVSANTMSDKIVELEKINEEMQRELESNREIIRNLKEENREKQRMIRNLESTLTSLRKKFDPSWENN